jgi:hypothetical protein
VDALGERVPAGGRWCAMLTFRAEWFKPVGELTSQQLGDYRSWLRRTMGQMPAQERQRAKEVLQALTAERGVRRRQRDEIDASGPVDEGRRRRCSATAVAVVAEDLEIARKAVLDDPR